MRLHELLAIEKNQQTQLNTLLSDTQGKFSRDHYFKGWVKSLKMIQDSPENDVIEKAGSETKDVITTVEETLGYLFDHWSRYEDTQIRKNVTNQKATANLPIGDVMIDDVPVDELMGLETRLTKIRDIFQQIPTLDASREWQKSTVREGVWIASRPDVTTKTERVITPVVLYEATKEHPAQIEKINKDEVVGTFTTVSFSGAITSLQKANALKRIDDLISEVKKSRMRANTKEVVTTTIGSILTKYLLEPLNN